MSEDKAGAILISVLGTALLGMTGYQAWRWWNGAASDIEFVAFVWTPWVAVLAISGVFAWSRHFDRPRRDKPQSR